TWLPLFGPKRAITPVSVIGDPGASGALRTQQQTEASSLNCLNHSILSRCARKRRLPRGCAASRRNAVTKLGGQAAGRPQPLSRKAFHPCPTPPRLVLRHVRGSSAGSPIGIRVLLVTPG